MTTYFNPDRLSRPLGLYCHVARATPGELFFIAGQLSVDESGAVVGAGDFEAQARQIFSNFGRVLESIGAGFLDVAQFTTYVVGDQSIADFYAARKEIFADLYPDGTYPPNTLLVVSRLVQPEFLLEVQGVVVR